MLSESDLEIADQWIRDNVLDNEDHEFDDAEEDGSTVKYFFHRVADHASVVYLVTVRQGTLFSIKKEVYHEEGQGDTPDEEEWIFKGKERKRQGSSRAKRSVGHSRSPRGKRSGRK